MPGKPKPKPKVKKGKPKAAKPKGQKGEAALDFRVVFAELLKAKKIPVPKELLGAPPEAYASQPASFVEQLERLPKAELVRFAEKVGGYAKRQRERALQAWETSPLIAEIRRRKLKEPSPPLKPTGASVGLTKPLAEWTDKQLLSAAERWSKMGR
ncbi:MAG: hypothetical protein WD826_06470 [Actinomycetota bacterium]